MIMINVFRKLETPGVHFPIKDRKAESSVMCLIGVEKKMKRVYMDV